MTTAQTLIDDAADLAGVKSESQSLTGGQTARFLRALNRLFDSWRDSGVDLGLSGLAAGDTVYIDDAEELAVVYNLATIIYELSSRPVNVAVYQRASELFATLQAKYLEPKEMSIPLALQNRRVGFDINNG